MTAVFACVWSPQPLPDIFLLAAEKAGVAPSACVVVEDSTSGVRAAQAADMEVVGYFAVIAMSFIPFEHGELFAMTFTMFIFTKAGTNLKDLFSSIAKQALHVQLWRSAEEFFTRRNGINPVFKSRSDEAKGSFGLYEIPLPKKTAQNLKQVTALFEMFYLRQSIVELVI